MQKQIFFNSSLPRSGSQLIQSILNQNDKVFCSGTSSLSNHVIQFRNAFHQLPEVKAADWMDRDRVFNDVCKGMIDNYYQFTDKPIIIDKSRDWLFFYNLLSQVLGEKPKVICTIRDLRAVYASFEKLYRKNPDRAYGWENHAQMQGITVEKRIEFWSKSNPIGVTIERLKNALEVGYTENFCIVKYEELVKDPAKEINQVYDFLGIDKFTHDFDNIAGIAENDEAHNFKDLHTIHSAIRPINRDYNDILGKGLCQEIIKSYEWYYKLFYPEVL